MATTLEELTALREQMAAAGLSTAEIDAKIETLKGEMPLEQGTIGPDYRHRPRAFTRC